MSDSNLPDPVDLTLPEPAPRPTSQIVLETAVVFLVVVIPQIFNSSAFLFLPRRGPDPYLYQYLAWLLGSFASISLTLYIIYRSGESYAVFGLKRFRFKVDLLGGLGVFVLGMLGHYAVWILLWMVLGRQTTSSLAQQDLSGFASSSGNAATLLVILVSLANGFAEELVVRAYFIPRLERIFRSTPLAILLSTAIFASYHTYQGSGGVISVAALGLVYGLIFARFRRLWPLAIAHAIQDLTAFLFWLT